MNDDSEDEAPVQPANNMIKVGNADRENDVLEEDEVV